METYNSPRSLQTTGVQNNHMILVQEEPRGASQLVEVPVTQSGVSRVMFPDVQQLRSTTSEIVIVKAIRLITATVLTNAPTSGLVTAPLTELKKISLTIYSEGWERGQLIPLFVLNDISDGTNPFRFHPTKFANWKNVDWSKTYLQFSNGTVSVASYAVLFDVEYLKLNNLGKIIEGAS